MRVTVRCPWCDSTFLWGREGQHDVPLVLGCRPCQAWAWVTHSPDPEDGTMDLWEAVMRAENPGRPPVSRREREQDVEYREVEVPIQEVAIDAQAQGYRWRAVWARRKPQTEKTAEGSS